MTRVSGTLGVLCCVGLALAQAGDTAKDLQLMQGTWAGTYLETGGAPIPDKEKNVKVKLVVKADKYTVYIDEMKFIDGQLKLDATKTPRTIDAVANAGPFKGMAQPGIYTITGDEMRLVFTKPNDPRPTEFKTQKGTAQMLATYKRVKDAK